MSIKSIFTKNDYKIAQVLVEIIYTNPFKPERELLNKEFFEIAKDSIGQISYSPTTDELTENQNIQSYIHISKQILDNARDNLKKISASTEHAQYSTYEHLVYLGAISKVVIN